MTGPWATILSAADVVGVMMFDIGSVTGVRSRMGAHDGND